MERWAMIFVTSIISSQEWIRLSEAARQAFPNEVLARGEIVRRFSLSGVAALKAPTDAEKKAQQQHQATMTVAGREGEKPKSPPAVLIPAPHRVDEITRRLLLEYLLWADGERGLVESVRTSA